MKLGVPKETFPGERRVAIVPVIVAGLRKLGIDVIVERGAGEPAGFPDSAYQEQQATLGSREDVFQADILAMVRTPGANPDNEAQLDNIRMLIDRVGQLRAQLQVTVVPSYNAATDALNGLVNRYNTLCVPNIIFKEAAQQAAAAGACPMQ